MNEPVVFLIKGTVDEYGDEYSWTCVDWEDDCRIVIFDHREDAEEYAQMLRARNEDGDNGMSFSVIETRVRMRPLN